jgi:signal transduction histidine kinase
MSKVSRHLGIVLALALAYVLAGRLGLLLAIPPGYATAIWPPSGIALGVLLLFGNRYWPGVWLGSFLTNLVISGPGLGVAPESIAPAVMIALGASAQALVGSHLIRRAIGLPLELLRERDILLFFVLAGPVACLVAPSVGIATLLAHGKISMDAAAYSWWTWWVGDTMGVSIFAPLMLVWLGGESWKPRRAAVTISLVATFTAGVLVFVYTSRLEWQQLERRFREDATDLVSVIDRRLDLNIERARSTGGLFAASQAVSREEFREFARFILGSHTDLQAMGWALRVPQAERAGFEAELRGQRPQRPTIFQLERRKAVPAAQRAEYFPISFIEPGLGNTSALGFDLASDPVRRHALELARDTGEPAASGPVALVQASGSHDGFLIFLPLYGERLSHQPSLAERREKLRGFVITVIRAHRLVSLASAGRKAAERLNLRIVDAERQELPLYDSLAGHEASATPSRTAHPLNLTHRAKLDVAGREWLLTFTPTPQFLGTHDALLAWMVLAGGLFFTALVGAGAMGLTGRTAAVEAQVRERTAELATSNERLAKADRVKSEFISTVSHELRTPLTSIRGSLGLLNGGAAGPIPPKPAELIGIAYRNTDRLQRLINDILDVEKLDSGKLSLELAPHSLPGLIKQAVEANAGYAQGCDVQLAVQLAVQQPLPDATVSVDPHRLLQVLANLLSNAAKFSPAGAAVEVSLHVCETTARVEVKDRGPGIPAEFQGRIFQRFAQADGSDSRRRGGTGLGLAISKALIERMGGVIDYVTAPGRGTSFFFDLPLTGTGASPAPVNTPA